MVARYWVAQTIEDVFRNEPRNIGVFISHQGEIAAKFYGEAEDCQIDGRKVRSLSHPDVYRQWVNYWRSMIGPSLDVGELLRTSGANYRVIQGGEVSDVGHDSASDVANYLYSMLVSEGGLREALTTDEEVREATLERSLLQEFELRNIFGVRDAAIRHPILKGIVVNGRTNIAHKPAFVQENGHLCVMESIDFMTQQKARSRDHAGLSAYMFNDVRTARPNTEAISIVKYTEADLENEDVEYALNILRNESVIVNWNEPAERQHFLADRVTTAHS